MLGTSAVSRDFLLSLKACGGRAAVSVVASRSRANAERFATNYGVPVVADSYEAAAASAEVDALYIATPPSTHEEYALAGIAAGKPVLLEKPFAADAASAARIIVAARAKKVFCMEGMWTRFQPLMAAVRGRLAAGDIGEIRAFRGEFCGPSRPDPAVSSFDPARGGGALMQKGVYAVSLARLFLGPIKDVTATARIGETGVDEDCALVLRHGSGAISMVRASNRTMGSNDVMIYGTKGILHIKSPIFRPPAARIACFPVSSGGGKPGKPGKPGKLRLLLAGGLGQGLKQRANDAIRALRAVKAKRVTSYYTGNGFQYEAEALMQAVAAGAIESDMMPLDESLEIMTIVDKARADWQRDART